MEYKFYFYDGTPTAERRPPVEAGEGIIIEEHRMSSDEAAMLYAGDFVSDINDDQMEFETAVDAEDYLNEIDSTSGDAFCVAIKKNDDFLYGDEDLLDYFMRNASDDDAVTESIIKEGVNANDTIDLQYKNLEITIYGDQRDADDWDEYEYTVEWTYSVDKNDVYQYLFENCLTDEELPEEFLVDTFDPNDDDDWARFSKWLDDNFDTIYAKYEKDILEAWEEDAKNQAEEQYDPDDYVDWDSMPGGHDDY